jgi:hypothetical protein
MFRLKYKKKNPSADEIRVPNESCHVNYKKHSAYGYIGDLIYTFFSYDKSNTYYWNWWRVLVNVVMNFRVPSNTVNFLTN